MPPFQRLRRKISAVNRYPSLAFGRRDRPELRLLGLVRNRVPGADAARVLLGRQHVITPRLAGTRGERVRVQFNCPAQFDVFDDLFLAGKYDLAAVGFDPEVVVDCGAYCGYFSVFAAGVFPRSRLFCFEANPANLPMLEAQLALLTVKVELHADAAYVRDGTAAFSGAAIDGALVSPDDPESVRRVSCIDFPRWLRACKPASLVWKLDVGGAELELLPATLPCLPRSTVCFLETHHPDAVCAVMLAPYSAAGFAIREVRRRPAESGDFSHVGWLLTRTA